MRLTVSSRIRIQVPKGLRVIMDIDLPSEKKSIFYRVFTTIPPCPRFSTVYKTSSSVYTAYTCLFNTLQNRWKAIITESLQLPSQYCFNVCIMHSCNSQTVYYYYCHYYYYYCIKQTPWSVSAGRKKHTGFPRQEIPHRRCSKRSRVIPNNNETFGIINRTSVRIRDASPGVFADARSPVPNV